MVAAPLLHGVLYLRATLIHPQGPQIERDAPYVSEGGPGVPNATFHGPGEGFAHVHLSWTVCQHMLLVCTNEKHAFTAMQCVAIQKGGIQGKGRAGRGRRRRRRGISAVDIP